MAGNAVGPVALLAAGTYLGYLTLTGRAANLVAFVKSGGTAVASSSGSSGSSSASGLSTVPASSTDGILANTAVPGTASNMSKAQAAAAALQAQQLLDIYNAYGVAASSN